MLLGNIRGKSLCKSWTFSSTMCKLQVQHVVEKNMFQINEVSFTHYFYTRVELITVHVTIAHC